MGQLTSTPTYQRCCNRQRYYYPSVAKNVKKWVEGCEQCARVKRVPNATITLELLNLSKWHLGAEDAMQTNLLPILPPSGGSVRAGSVSPGLQLVTA